MSKGLIHHKQTSSNQEVQTKSYKSLTKQIQEFEKHLQDLHDQELKIQTEDLADVEYTKWLQTRSFCSGMVTPQEYKDTATKYDPKVEVKIWRKADQFKSVKESFQKCFKQTRELFQTFYRNMKFESLRLEPVVYECLLSMAHHYSSGFHLLQASRNLSNEKSRNYREYSFTEEIMAYRNNLVNDLVLLVSERCQEYLPAP